MMNREDEMSEEAADVWVFEIWATLMSTWLETHVGTEAECRERYDWYAENRPELVPQFNLRNTTTDPEPPAPPDI